MKKSEREAHQESIHNALALDYVPQNLTAYYDNWAASYDRDVFDAGYRGPDSIAGYLERLLQATHDKPQPRQQIEIMDAGCGTGLVGHALHHRGYRQIDGFDLSEAMVGLARARGVYRTLASGHDMTQELPYSAGRYDVTLCCGVFTQGHVHPEALFHLVRITKAGGLVLVSTRRSYFEQTPFRAVCDALEAQGKARLVHCMKDGPYVEEEDAHYWSLQATGS